jgi:hypothetical protein
MRRRTCTSYTVHSQQEAACSAAAARITQAVLRACARAVRVCVWLAGRYTRRWKLSTRSALRTVNAAAHFRPRTAQEEAPALPHFHGRRALVPPQWQDDAASCRCIEEGPQQQR